MSVKLTVGLEVDTAATSSGAPVRVIQRGGMGQWLLAVAAASPVIVVVLAYMF